jgi:hypothetical protein
MCDMQKRHLCISVYECRLAVISRAPCLGDLAGLLER